MAAELPPALQMYARFLDGQSPTARELFQYAIAVLLIEQDQAKVVERHVIDERVHLTLRTITGDTFTVVIPNVDKELLAEMVDQARDLLREESEGRDAENYSNSA